MYSVLGSIFYLFIEGQQEVGLSSATGVHPGGDPKGTPEDTRERYVP
jgi:hypothetical protein